MNDMRRELLSDMGFSEKAISILDQNLNIGKMEKASIVEKHQGRCGDILFIALKIQQNIIKNAMYEYIGCAGLQACASALTEMIKGMKLDEAAQIKVSDILHYLNGIPKQKYECAEIACDALHKAIFKWQNPSLKVL